MARRCTRTCKLAVAASQPSDSIQSARQRGALKQAASSQNRLSAKLDPVRIREYCTALYLGSEISYQPPIVGKQSIINAIGLSGNSPTESAVYYFVWNWLGSRCRVSNFRYHLGIVCGPVPQNWEGKRMVSSFIGNEVPGNRLRVRVPCLPL